MTLSPRTYDALTTNEGYDIVSGPRFSPAFDSPVTAMTLRALIVFGLLAAIIVPVVLAEMRRFRPPAARRVSQPRPPKREAAAKPPLRLVVNKNDMDRELAALLARDSRKPGEIEE